MRVSVPVVGLGLTLGAVVGWIAFHAQSPSRVYSPANATTLATAATVPADGVMTYLFNAPESALDNRYEYHWEILRTALERTTAKWGGYRMQPAVSMDERRQTFELKSTSGRLTVMYLGTSKAMEDTLIPVRIPVDKNLGGYMVMLIRSEDQPKFSAVTSLGDLRKFRIGLGLGWLDVDILRANGFNVVTGSSYDGLFDMLANHRFDAFSRAAVEVLDEYAARKEKIPDLEIENTLLLYYPLPMYFWFSRSPQGQRLADRASEGMMAMIQDGTYDQIFFKYQQRKIDQLQLSRRKIFRIENPLLKELPLTPFDDKRLWFDPTAGGIPRDSRGM